MKGRDIFCASQAATAICLSMEQGSSSSTPSSSAFLLSDGGGRAIDRHNPIIRDARRITKSVLPPCTSTTQPPISPRPHYKKNKIKKKNKRVPFAKGNEEQTDKSESKIDGEKIDKNDGSNGSDTATINLSKSWRCTKPGDFISPHGSTRYLLDFNNTVEKLSLEENSKFKVDDDKTEEELCDAIPPSPSHSPDQVVVLRVSLHCRGCERKMRKHLSRMEGVKSFEIDFAAKKVTVSGKVTAVSVLSSISKVKSNAQLWPSSIPPSDNLINSEFNNIYNYKESSGAL